jgi:HPr kinase/phosphorylase
MGELFEKNKEDFQITLLSGKNSLQRTVSTHEIHFPGLALSGFLYHFHHSKIQFISDMEWHYLNSLEPKARALAVGRLFEHPIPAVVVTSSREPHKELLSSAKKNGVPLYQTKLNSGDAARRISLFLEDYFAPKLTLHASLVDVYGIGMLYTGKSGIGKSECALDLVERGHRLVADDIVTITRKNDSLIGAGNPLLGHHMEIRGIGIINIQQLFGIRAIRLDKKIEIIVELVEWDPKTNYERLGLTEHTTDLLGIKVDKVSIPIFPGKNITVISEVIAMNMLLKYNGVNTAQEFNRKLIDTLQTKRQQRLKE